MAKLSTGNMKYDLVDTTVERSMAEHYAKSNDNWQRTDDKITDLNKSVANLGSKDRVIIVSYKYGGDLVNLNNVDVSYLLAYSNSSLNAPTGIGAFWYVETIFYNYPNGNRMQTATTYADGTAYRRVFNNGTWQPWKLMTAT